MTLQAVVNKTGILLLLCIGSAVTLGPIQLWEAHYWWLA